MTYYLGHALINPTPDKIMKILKDGYLLSNIESGAEGFYAGSPLEYVYFSLINKSLRTSIGGVVFVINPVILNRRSFRYALSWIGDEIDKTIKVKTNNSKKIIKKIIDHINAEDKKTFSHEILLKKKVNLDKYLVAIYPKDMLTNDVTNYLSQRYKNVRILNDETEL